MTRVLVVDDESDVCDAIVRVVERAGFEADAAADAAAALEKCRTEPVNVVLTDIVMPGENGVDFIRSLREEFPQIGIIAMSGGGNLAVAGYQPDAVKTAAYMAAAERAGANFCLTKPFERSDLVEKLNALVATTSD
jgi:CheY-like chemotaxis protein